MWLFPADSSRVDGMADGEPRESGGEDIGVCPKRFVPWVLTPAMASNFSSFSPIFLSSSSLSLVSLRRFPFCLAGCGYRLCSSSFRSSAALRHI
jgi:hypothetical protein